MPIQKGKSTFTVFKDYRAAERNKKPLDNSDEQDITNTIVVITGANSGIGEAAAFEFAKRGAVLVMPCRNIGKAKAVVLEIRSQFPDAKMELFQLDLGDLSSIRKCAQQIKDKYSKIDILVNNAGILTFKNKLENTVDGLELHMAVNHLGPLLFTHLLLDLIKNGAPSRILFTSSMAFQYGELDPDDFMLEKRGNFAGFSYGAYGNSKLAINYCASILAKKLAGTGVNVYAICPGYVKTGFQEGARFFEKFLVNRTGITAAEGAENILYCALMNSTAKQTGLMYRTNSAWEGVMEELDDKIGQQVWNKSLSYIQVSEF